MALLQRLPMRVLLAEIAAAGAGHFLESERGIVGLFQRDAVIHDLAAAHDRPEIFPMSNDVETLHGSSPHYRNQAIPFMAAAHIL